MSNWLVKLFILLAPILLGEEDTCEEEGSCGAEDSEESSVSLTFINNSGKPVDVYLDNGKTLGVWLGDLAPRNKELEYPNPKIGDIFYVTQKAYRKRIHSVTYSAALGNTITITEDMIPKQSLQHCEDRDSRCKGFAGPNNEECHINPGWMIVNCPKTCNACEIRDPKVRCTFEYLNLTTVPSYADGNIDTGEPGSLQKMFSSIEERFGDVYDITVLSEDPWIVQFDNFFNAEDAAGVLSTVSGRWERSTDTGAMNEFGESGRVVSKTRTSENAWCRSACENHPASQSIISKIVDVTGIPYENFESFQILKYSVGQFYRTHHDMSQSQTLRVAGPRILTFFLYFSDVEEGGETNFPRLGISVKPKLGRAILWPSVMDHNNLKQDSRTYHQALPVEKGTKFAANSWIHLYNFVKPNLWGCTGSFD